MSEGIVDAERRVVMHLFASYLLQHCPRNAVNTIYKRSRKTNGTHTSTVRNFVLVGPLNLCCDANEGASQCVLGRGEHHSVLNLGSRRGPRRMEKRVVRGLTLRAAIRERASPTDESELVPSAFQFVFKVKNSPSALRILLEILEEQFVLFLLSLQLRHLFALRLAFYPTDDLGFCFVELVEDVFVLVAEFELLVSRDTFIVDPNAGCLWITVRSRTSYEEKSRLAMIRFWDDQLSDWERWCLERI